MSDEPRSLSRPDPDPTKLTTDAVHQAVSHIEKLFIEKLNGLRDLIEQKLEGVKTEFQMRDIALAAAFKAAEAAVQQQNTSNTLAIDKSGEGFTKQIDGLDGKIDDLKERIADLAGKNWSTVGAYLIGAIGVAALVIAAILHSQP